MGVSHRLGGGVEEGGRLRPGAVEAHHQLAEVDPGQRLGSNLRVYIYIYIHTYIYILQMHALARWLARWLARTLARARAHGRTGYLTLTPRMF